MYGNSMHGNQEVPVLPAALRKQRAGGGTPKGNLLMHGAGKSDCRIVPEKVPNKGDPCGETGGGTGGKAVDRGERNERTHGPGTEPDNNNRVKGASGRAGSRTARQRVKAEAPIKGASQVHNAAAPCERETAAGQLLSAEEAGCTGSGSSDMGRV